MDADSLEVRNVKVKVPVRSNFPNFMFLHFSKVYVAVTHQAKPFSNPSTGSPFFFFFSTVFLAILRPPSIGHVPTGMGRSDVILVTKTFTWLICVS